MFTGWLGLLGYWNVLLCRISLGKSMVGLIGVNQRSSRISSRASLMLGLCKVLFFVCVCHSSKLLDLGKWGEDMECSM